MAIASGLLLKKALLLFFLLLDGVEEFGLFSFLVGDDSDEGLEILGAFFETLLGCHFLSLDLLVPIGDVFQSLELCFLSS